MRIYAWRNSHDKLILKRIEPVNPAPERVRHIEK